MSKSVDKNQGLTIITTHINADFDGLASMLAAQKLYPGSVVIFPGSQEKNLRNFFINSMAYLFNMADIKDIDLDCVKKLVMVDTRQPHRIGPLGELTRRDDVEIHVYDHHPPSDKDVEGHFGVQKITGATATILTEIIKEKAIEISPDEATILSLGIYEDTGSFTFASTTVADFHAAAWLLSRGAKLNDVASLISREISPEQVGLLNDMIQAARRFNINGIEVVLTTITSDKYIADFAFLVHKMVKMERLDAIFAIARMADKIYVVARSRIPEVDVGAIVALTGGGGHPYAAAATIKEKTLAQAEQQLIELLYKKIIPRRLARDLMSTPPIKIDEELTCAQAGNLLTQYNVNALLVIRQTGPLETLTGIITRQVIEKALYHDLAGVPVKDYMTTDFAVVGPMANLHDIQEKIIDNKQRILPVMDGNITVGVVTRTDLLNILVRRSRLTNGDTPDPYSEPVNVRTRNIKKFMSERLSERILETLRSIGQVAQDTGVNAYVVGGFVRDLFLYRPNEDIDIVIEGEGIAFARQFARLYGARLHTHTKFGTAVIIFADGFKIDVATARMEYYKFPAALPTVEMSSIKLDLFRRDFTINTLAIRLNPNSFGTLIDFFAAHKDIKEKTVRVLHNLSFVEDPTRVFRAIRFEQRFGFSIGKLTAGLIENAIKMDFFKRLSGHRVFSELRQILEEENPTATIVRLQNYKLLKVVHPSINIDKHLEASFKGVKKVLAWYDLLFMEEPYIKWPVYFMALTRHCDRKTVQEICTRFELPPRLQTLFCRLRFEADRCIYSLERKLPKKNSTIYNRLHGLKIELRLYMMAMTTKEPVKRAISRYCTKLRFVALTTSGKDLMQFGLKPGPVFRQVLDATRDAKLNGKIETNQDEHGFIKNYIQRHKLNSTGLPHEQ
ncbi:MAG: CBS domain-containing protein [Desulfobacterales bacterium]|nr:CBS domain-containing protein [Desulfobacterales bacterium]